ncbi:MAG: ATP-binding protein [Anaerolineae bacterium]|nr:ATP-binding protein [Anaerolineae bacterium]
MTQTKQFKLHMPGLLEVLAGSLYSNPKVGIRELIQNAHDSCIRRAVESGRKHFRPRINISTDEDAGTVIIQDNGNGLTADEIDDYLATIGRSYTRQLRGELSIFEPERAEELIGQFGFGFLSAFMLAEEVTLITRSWQEGSPTLRWHSAGGEQYELSKLPTHAEVGTTITLKIRPAAAFLFNEDLLTETVQQFADFLPIPIHLNGDPHPVNLMHPPWQAANIPQATDEYIQRAFAEPDPLAIIPLHDMSVDLGYDMVDIPLNGFLFIPPTTVVSVREYGDLRVYVRHMFICDDEKDLLPTWARFVRGVIDCPYLQPTASREAIRRDETFTAVQKGIEKQLSEALREIAQNDSPRWRKIVQRHSDVITGWAVRDNAFFDEVADIVTFRTSRGRLTLPEYLEITGNTLYYATHELGSLQEQLLAEGQDAPVIEAVWFAVHPFLLRYAERQGNVRLVRMDGDVSSLLKTISKAPYSDLLAACERSGIRADVASYDPAAVPALIVHPEDAEFHLESRRALDAGDIPPGLAGLVGSFLDETTGNEDEWQGMFYLNANNPFVRQLSQRPPDDATLDSMMSLLYQIARLFSGRTMTAQDAAAAFQTITDNITNLRSEG